MYINKYKNFQNALLIIKNEYFNILLKKGCVTPHASGIMRGRNGGSGEEGIGEAKVGRESRLRVERGEKEWDWGREGEAGRVM
jgi:hypothetical protein